MQCMLRPEEGITLRVQLQLYMAVGVLVTSCSLEEQLLDIIQHLRGADRITAKKRLLEAVIISDDRIS